jgi:hypothetical protein
MFKLPSPALQFENRNTETIFRIRERENRATHRESRNESFQLPPPIISSIDKNRETVFIINQRNTYENHLKRIKQRIEALKELNSRFL